MRMTSRTDIMIIYDKERKYQREVFGDYNQDKSLSFPSFIAFLKTYAREIELYYTKRWQTEKPDWMIDCAEHNNHGVAPIKAYEQTIKLMALAGAALETYTQLDPDNWRKNPHQDAEKWKNQTGKGEDKTDE